MGWTGTNLDHTRPVTAMEAITHELGDEYAGRVLRHAKKGTVVYAAVRGHKDPNEVWGLVLLAETRPQDGVRWLYTKAMDETMGPGYYDCPAKVLDLLTPTESKHAIAWRERCRTQLAKPKLRPGQRVRFAQAISFSNGRRLQSFQFVKGSRFRNNGTVYSIPRWRQREYEVRA